jgi:hypothetical protein
VAIWDQLNTKKIGDAPGTEIQKQTDPLHLEEANRQSLEDTVLINEATLRSDGGPIPGTQNLTQTIVAEEDTRTTVFTPSAGEVYSLDLVGAERSGGSGTVVHTLWLKDIASGVIVPWFYYSTSDSNPIFTGDSNWPDMPFIMDENFTLEYRWTGGTGITNYTCNVIAHRIR